ncbi:MAG: coproporphyrinogen-III oxidase family protein [Fusobacterium sp.]|uniref:coproporphyrinogen-III oxidase family protein n=1 Tax=Fusobacterium sp. TaxID=68766 RepID=UPI0026DD03E0|nr:coproporphyrinogen-III oxidase family protein [Fusobacterium sp.]MDO4691144.1 coproporphyrinogen-III oxidase family protein [Fusobacterium sp.]
MFKIRYKSHHDVEAVISNLVKPERATKEDFLKIMNSKNEKKQLGIYFHTPYCDKICSFCNMNRKQLDNDLEEYTEYLCNEIIKNGQYEFVKTSEVDVVFFGGGTPTIFKASQLERILKTLRENFVFAKEYEMTFETTLHNLSLDKVEILNKYGVNRISVGIQTFSDRGRKYLNRTYDKTYAVKRLKEIKEKFNGLICIDIIYNYPNQTDEEILEDVTLLSEIGVASASFYSLMVQEGSKISADRDKKEEDIFVYDIKRDEEIHNLFYEKALEKGYKLLEFTKITDGRDKYMYIRNNNALKNLLPIGTGAGGRIENIGCYNFNKDMSFYSRSTELQRRLSTISGMMQFDKFSLEKLRECCTEKAYGKAINILKEYEKEGYIEIKDNYVIYLTKGIFWGNSMSAKLIEEIFSDM